MMNEFISNDTNAVNANNKANYESGLQDLVHIVNSQLLILENLRNKFKTKTETKTTKKPITIICKPICARLKN